MSARPVQRGERAIIQRRDREYVHSGVSLSTPMRRWSNRRRKPNGLQYVGI